MGGILKWTLIVGVVGCVLLLIALALAHGGPPRADETASLAATSIVDYQPTATPRPVVHTGLPAGVTPKGCIMATQGHPVVMFYTEDTKNPNASCRRKMGKGDYLLTRMPDMSTRQRECTAVKTDGTQIIDIYDDPTDVFQNVATFGSVMCTIFESNDHWSVTRP